MIHADESLADRFDEHGCLVPDAWQDAQIDLQTRQMRVVQGPAEQADAVVETIASLQRDVIARTRSSLACWTSNSCPICLRRLQQSHLAARWVVGKTLRETAPYRLLAALSSFIHRGRFADFASLVRHPDVETWLELRGAAADWLADVDRYYNKHLPPRLGHWLGDVAGPRFVAADL